MTMRIQPHPPLPPFTPETAAQKLRPAEDAWNSREQIIEFLTRNGHGSWITG